jgi:parvulin-like peptidyl-prolyl isomerase
MARSEGTACGDNPAALRHPPPPATKAPTPMRPPKSFVVRVAIYSLLLLYIAGDLFVFKGPLHRRLRSADPNSPQAIAEAKKHGLVAQVYGQPILVTQLERAVADRLRLQGRTLTDLGGEEHRLLRYAALNDLVDHQILRVKAKVHGDDLPLTDEEIDAEMARFTSRFSSRQELESAMKAQGIGSEKEMRYRLAARLQQEKYIASRVVPPTTVTEKQAREWFDEHEEDYQLPERIHARHVFVATLETDPVEARKTLAGALDRLQKGETKFEDLAAKLSEDERSKTKGGDLGWFTRERLATDFTAAVFALPDKKPSLVRTKLGWHLVEVLERKPAEPIPFEQARDDVIAALESRYREQATKKFREDLRKLERPNVHIFRDVIEGL